MDYREEKESTKCKVNIEQLSFQVSKAGLSARNYRVSIRQGITLTMSLSALNLILSSIPSAKSSNFDPGL